ncbi:MAG: adenylate kinase family protein [Candidatus Micrarchaeia archaeon]
MHEIAKVIGITGTPGVGKSTFAKRLARETNSKIVEINDVVEKYKLFNGIDKEGSKIANMRKLSAKLNSIVAKSKENCIVVGHLLPDLKLHIDICITLRYDPLKLAKRLEARNYPMAKIGENLVAECMDYCGEKIASGKNAKEHFEINSASERQKSTVINYTKKRLKGKRAKMPKFEKIDSFRALEKLAKMGKYGI